MFQYDHKLFALFLLYSESENQEPDNGEILCSIFATYELQRHQSDPSFATVILQFRVGGKGGTTVEFDEGQQLLVDGKSAVLQRGDDQILNVSGSYYEREISLREGDTAVTVSFVDKDGQTHDQAVSVPTLVEVTSPLNGATVDFQTGFNVKYAPTVPVTGVLSFTEEDSYEKDYVVHSSITRDSDDGVIEVKPITDRKIVDSNASFQLQIQTIVVQAPNGFETGRIESSYSSPSLNWSIAGM